MNPIIFGQMPVPAPGSVEGWLVSATAVVSMALLFRKFLAGRRESGEGSPGWGDLREHRAEWREEMRLLRGGMNARMDGLDGKLDAMKSELLAAGEQRCETLHRRLNELEKGLARVDERTLRRGETDR